MDSERRLEAAARRLGGGAAHDASGGEPRVSLEPIERRLAAIEGLLAERRRSHPAGPARRGGLPALLTTLALGFLVGLLWGEELGAPLRDALAPYVEQVTGMLRAQR